MNQKEYWERESLKKRRNPTHSAVKAFAIPKIREIVRVVGKADKKLLDVGCGNGFFTLPLSNLYDTKGIDFSEKMVSINPVDNCVVGDANDINEKDGAYNAVFCSNLLHHLDDPNVAVADMKRVSNEWVILSEPNRNNPLMFLFNLINKAERGALKFSLSYMKGLCRRQGLKIVKARTMGAIVPNKTPKSLVPFFKLFDNVPFLGFYILVIARKDSFLEQERKSKKR